MGDRAPVLDEERSVAIPAAARSGAPRSGAGVRAGRGAVPASARPPRDRAGRGALPVPRGVPPRRATRPVPGQLPLPLEALPVIPLEPEWQGRPRLWGHAYHPMCSYLASFPAALAHGFVARYTRPGDVVLDPFSGRGTTPLQACAEGRIGVGNDLSPLAHLLTAAKVEPPTARALEARLAALRIAWSREAPAWDDRAAGLAGGGEPVPPDVALAFHPRTLGQVLFVRSSLRLADPADRFLAAAVAGILHGRRPGYLSGVMPNVFSMPPRYVRAYAARTGFRPPERELFALLAAKLHRLARDGRPSAPGIALFGDARDAGARARAALRGRALPDRVRLVLASPPYLRVVRYGSANWLRAWFLGFSAAAIDASLDAHRRGPYAAFLREVLAGLRPVLADDAVVALVLGDVDADGGRPTADGLPIGLADEVWESAARPEGYLLAGVVRDEVAAARKVTKLWGAEAGRATQVERILVLAVSEVGRRRAIAGAAVPVDWRWPPRR